MNRNFTIVRQSTIGASPEECWRFLTQPDLVGQWFADTRGGFESGNEFEFHFGDGDFFRGAVDAVDAPYAIEFHWKFMGAGLTSRIEYALLPYKQGSTLVTVIDRGEHTPAGAIEMCEGWDDFLMRLERRIRTGENSRYRWTEQISCGAAISGSVEEAARVLMDADFWIAFDGASVSVREGDNGTISLTIADRRWPGLSTKASLRLRPTLAGGAFVAIDHSGFDALPAAIQFDERKRYAGYWASLLPQLEALSAAPVAAA